MREPIFRFYENWILRNWAYTVAFAVVVPIGGRFAYLAMRHGSDLDKVLAMVGGTVMGLLSVVTLVRYWEVPPVQTASDKISESPGDQDQVVNLLSRYITIERMRQESSALGGIKRKW